MKRLQALHYFGKFSALLRKELYKKCRSDILPTKKIIWDSLFFGLVCHPATRGRSPFDSKIWEELE